MVVVVVVCGRRRRCLWPSSSLFVGGVVVVVVVVVVAIVAGSSFCYLSVLLGKALVLIFEFVAHFFGAFFPLLGLHLEQQEFVRVIGGRRHQDIAQLLIPFADEEQLSERREGRGGGGLNGRQTTMPQIITVATKNLERRLLFCICLINFD